MPAWLRILTGAVFVATGAVKLVRHDVAVADFERWHVPLADAMVYAVGGLEVVGGVALVLGLGVRWFALALLADMVAALVTAGTVDGGVHIVAPVVLGAVCAVTAVRGDPR